MATVNDIIDFNNLDNGKITIQQKPFNLYKMVNNVCSTFREEAAQKDLRFDCSIDKELANKTVIGDALRLSQVLFHLIGNAIKFTEEGLERVEIQGTEQDEPSLLVEFRITDSGIGISQSKLQQILEPFKKNLRRTQRQYQATLGLTIAGQLLKLYDSELKIDSVEGKGSSFYFMILYPLADQQDEVEQVLSLSADQHLANLRVLCVDDEKLNLMVVKKILAKWGIVADEVFNGQEAVEICRTKAYDVILMDINMLIMDGFEASKLIKGLNDTGFDPPKIIALTASVGAAKEEVSKFPSIDDCVLKPFKPEELREKLSKWGRGYGP